MASSTTFGRRGAPSAASSAPSSKPASTPRIDRPVEGGGLVWLLFSFDGRIPRLPFWMSQIGLWVSYQILSASLRGLGHAIKAGEASHALTPAWLAVDLGELLALLLALGCLVWIGLAVVVKRWHDRGKGGAWALLGFIPLVGWLWQGIECGFLEGTLGPNEFGPSPKGIAGVVYGDPVAEAFS